MYVYIMYIYNGYIYIMYTYSAYIMIYNVYILCKLYTKKR